jgi:hypothetical protein
MDNSFSLPTFDFFCASFLVSFLCAILYHALFHSFSLLRFVVDKVYLLSKQCFRMTSKKQKEPMKDDGEKTII